MKMTYNNGKFSVDLEGNQKDVWSQLAVFQEIFEEKCGKCGSENVRFVVRKAKDAKGKEYDYYELRCKDCGAKLAFGSLEDGSGLFPKRKDEEGNYKGEYGWCLWNKETQKEE